MQNNEATGKPNFDIKFKFDSSVSREQRDVFQQAANRWENIIDGDLPNVYSPLFGSSVDDLVIGTTVSRIDGPGGTLGGAAPQEFRVDSLLPASGVMKFDAADIPKEPGSNEQFFDTVLHEMGHVLGIGAGYKWEQLLYDEVFGGARFLGNQAAEAYNQIFNNNKSFVPVEEEGGPGTAFAHWDEQTLDNELMTGFLNSGQGVENPLSQITVGALADLGYSVNPDAVDSDTSLGDVIA